MLHDLNHNDVVILSSILRENSIDTAAVLNLKETPEGWQFELQFEYLIERKATCHSLRGSLENLHENYNEALKDKIAKSNADEEDLNE